MTEQGGLGRVVEVSGDRSIGVGGDVINSVLVTGDHNTLFVGTYARLQDAYLDPAQLYAELEVDRFTGRDWLLSAVDRFIGARDRGYLVLEAEAGMGKSTFLAWLARERGYPHHFVRLMVDPNNDAEALRNLCAQLIIRWDLDTYAAGGILPPAADRPEFLSEVLAAAAERRAAGGSPPIVILVDGLNETVPGASHNPLGLPAHLPPGVYVVMTQRPVHIPFRFNVPREVIHIDPGSVENQRDARTYLENRSRDDLRAALERDGVAVTDFVETLLAKSQGVWVYLHYAIAEIVSGRLSAAAIGDLPVGLWQYYAHYWRGWQRAHEERWHELDLPLLSAIAVAAEALPAETLAELAGTRRVSLVEELLDDHWRPFLQVEEAGDELRYRTFHDSLAEFLRGQVGGEGLTAAERAAARRFAQGTRTAHSHYADRYLDAWGGLAASLPSLGEDGNEEMDDGYGLRQLAYHLVGAGRQADLHRLMSVSRAEGDRAVNVWFAVHLRTGAVAAYRRDVNLAWNTARLGDAPSRAALMLRYALITCSLNSLADATPPALWSLLVRHGELSPREAITQAREIPTAEDRAEALTSLIGAVPDELREEVEREAIAAVRAVPDEFWRVGELWRLYGHVSTARKAELSSIVRSLVDPYFQVVAYRLLGADERIPAMTMPRTGHGHEHNLESPSGMAASAAFIEDYRRRRVMAAARLNAAGFSATGPRGDDPAEQYWRAHLMTLSAAEQAAAQAHRLVREARDISGDIGDVHQAAAAWGELGRALGRDPGNRAWALAELAPMVSVPLHRGALLLGLDAVPDMVEVFSRGVPTSVLSDLAPLLGDQTGVAALADNIAEPRARVEFLLTMAERETAYAGEALGAIREHGLGEGWEAMLRRALPMLDGEELAVAVALVDEVAEVQVRWNLRAALAIRLTALGRLDEASAALAGVPGQWRAEPLLHLAKARLRAGEISDARALAAGVPYATWRAEVEALAIAALEPEAADQAEAELRRDLANLDPASLITVLIRMAATSPGRRGARLLAEALAGARALEDYYERSVALLTVVEGLVACGDQESALEVCEEIPVDLLRADALIVLLAGPGPQILEGAADQAAAVKDRPARARVRLAALRSALRDDPGRSLAPGLFDAALEDLASGHRTRLVTGLPLLVEVVAELAGADAIRALAVDMVDIWRWWP